MQIRTFALPCMLLLAATTAACARQVAVLNDPAGSAAAVLVVGNQTDWELMIEAVPPHDPAGTLTLGRVQPHAAATFENVPTNRPLRLRASVIGSPQFLAGPERSFQPGETWEWLVRPGAEWRIP